MPMRPRKSNICQRVKLYRDRADYLWAQPVSGQAPVLKDVAEANGVLIIPKDSYGFHAGEQVLIELLWPYTVTF